MHSNRMRTARSLPYGERGLHAGWSQSGGVSVRGLCPGGLCPGGSLSRGSLSRGGLCQGVVREGVRE